MYLPSKRPIIFTHPLFTGIMGLIWLSVATIPIPAFSSVPQWELENAAGMKAYQQKQFAPAKTHFLNALSSLGNMQTPSPEEATTLNNLGAVHEALGEYEEAELRYRQSLLIIEKIQGPNHPDIVLSLNNLAFLHFSKGEFDKAEVLWTRALDILENFLGADNPHLIQTLSTLGLLSQAQENYEIAEDYFTRAIRITEDHLGPQHPQFKKVLGHYANFLRITHRIHEAEMIEKRGESIPHIAPDLIEK